MQRATIRWTRFLIGGALVLHGCSSELSQVADPIKGAAASMASYAYSTPYGEMWDVDGELIPAGYSNPWNAVISSAESWTEWPETCTTYCNVEFDAYMTGLWHYTEQTIHWQVGGASGSSLKSGYGWSCAVRVSPLNCFMAERTDSHVVYSVPECRWTAKVHSDHAAWWGSWFDITIFERKLGPAGRVSASSTGLDVNHDHCNVYSPGSGAGGTGGSQQCYDYYLVWTDWKGYHEVYLGTECFGDEM